MKPFAKANNRDGWEQDAQNIKGTQSGHKSIMNPTSYLLTSVPRISIPLGCY